MEAYSLDLRKRVARACDDRLGTLQDIAEMMEVSVSFITKLLRRRRTEKTLAAKPHAGGGKPSLQPDALKRLRKLVEQQPDATLCELCQRLCRGGGSAVVPWTMCRALKRLGLVRKKSPFTPRNAIRLGSSGCVVNGVAPSLRSIRTSWCSSMRAG